MLYNEEIQSNASQASQVRVAKLLLAWLSLIKLGLRAETSVYPGKFFMHQWWSVLWRPTLAAKVGSASLWGKGPEHQSIQGSRNRSLLTEIEDLLQLVEVLVIHNQQVVCINPAQQGFVN